MSIVENLWPSFLRENRSALFRRLLIQAKIVRRNAVFPVNCIQKGVRYVSD